MSKGRINDFYNQYEELVAQFEKQEKLLKENNKLIKNLNKTIANLNDTIDDLKEENDDLRKEILRLKSKNDKDSSNSSKPSSTNGFKKVITNRREKSNRTKGGQLNHKPYTLINKLSQFINSENVREEIIEINKNEHNKNKRYIEKVVIDIEITKVAKRYRYYPNEDGKYNIPECHNQYVKYGNTIKSMCVDLMTNLYNSTDGVTRFIEDITNGGMTISKGTLVNWLEDISKLLEPEVIHIEKKLLESYYINHDEAQVKVDGNGFNILTACNKTHTRLWVHEHKSQEALDEIGFLPQYKGVIVKDGTELYNKYGIVRAQCISHILRYLVDYYTKINHKAPKKMSKFLSRCNTLRNTLIEKGIKSFSADEYEELIKEYDTIIDEWENELRNDTDNYLFDEELCLWKRMKYDNKSMDATIRGDRDEILYFLQDFNVPATNNDAEVAHRNAKIKQKIGKWRSVDGAEIYVIIKLHQYIQKNLVNILGALKSAFNNQTIIV